MLRVLLFIAGGVLAISFTGCADNHTTDTHKPRKVYYARDVQTGSHLQRAYTEPPPPDATPAPGYEPGEHAFAPSGVATEGGRR